MSENSRGGWASSPAVRAVMRANRRRDTRPELAVRRLVHAEGLRYRVDHPPLAERPRRRADLVFTRAKVAVYIDGCFWHGCALHHRPASKNAEYWSAKIAENQRRDQDTDSALRSAGWVPLRFWEHEAPESVAAAITAVVRGRA